MTPRTTSSRNRRHETQQARLQASQQRERAAAGRASGGEVRAGGARTRAEAAQVRDDAARTRDDAARVRDQAAKVRDDAARARDLSSTTRDEALRRRLAKGSALDARAWDEILELDRAASEHLREAVASDRAASDLDRAAADKDREAAERDRTAASKDRDAADSDRDAAEKDRLAADADREAAEIDRQSSERDLQHADERLSRSEQLAVMGQVISGVAHDINTPLAALLTTLTSLQLELGDGERWTPLLADARLAADRIVNVMVEMRSWLEGTIPVSREPIDVRSLVEHAVQQTAARVESAAVLSTHLDATSRVTGAPAQLGQVLSTLLINAANAITGQPQSNHISVTARTVDQTVQIEVVDTGPGISADEVAEVFDPYFTPRNAGGGMGLGLALCQRIVQAHHGTLSVTSVVGQGTTFRIELPVDPASRARPPPGAGLTRLLLIDDDVLFTHSIVRMLKGKAVVTVAANGVAGLEALLAEGAQWDLVLCDLMMPRMNGLELHQRLLEVSPALAASMVFVTGGATTPETANFLSTMSNQILLKPFDPARLFALVESRRPRATGG